MLWRHSRGTDFAGSNATTGGVRATVYRMGDATSVLQLNGGKPDRDECVPR
jgi:hypothetical protein